MLRQPYFRTAFMPADSMATRFLAAARPKSVQALPIRTSLGDQVYERLLSDLISLKVSPGSRIAVDALVREMGVSQTPIRAALIRLESDGLVVKTHNVGYSAAPMPTRERFDQIYEMRLLLEPFAAAKTALNMTEASRRQLAAIEQSMARPTSSDVKLAYGKFALQDSSFHAWIAERSGNELAADALARLYAHTHLFRLRFHSQVTEEAIAEHAEIVAALFAGDPDGSRDAMRSHIERSRARMAPFFANIE